jgi:hypothetical protein
MTTELELRQGLASLTKSVVAQSAKPTYRGLRRCWWGFLELRDRARRLPLSKREDFDRRLAKLASLLSRAGRELREQVSEPTRTDSGKSHYHILN